MIENLGYVKTLKAVGGFTNLKKILGDEYFTKDNKISLISDLSYEYGTRGEINFDEYGIDISLGKDVYSDGSYQETFVHYVDDNQYFYLKTWMFDEDGWMLDEPIDEGYMSLESLGDTQINEILDILIDKFL